MSENRTVLLQLLRDSTPKLRAHLLSTGPLETVLAVCELALNISEGNFHVNVTSKQHQYITQLADRHVPLKRKRYFLVNRPDGRKLLQYLLKGVK